MFLRNIAIIAAISSLTILTGCATKQSKSTVVVAPISNTGYATGASAYSGANAYTGGPLVDNNAAITSSAAAMQGVVYFDFDSDVIRADAAAVLDQHAAFLSANQGATVLIAGHTDERGSREYNMSLGERRAVAVRTYLASRGANVGAVEIISYGEEQPAVAGSNEEAWAQNRRAELNY